MRRFVALCALLACTAALPADDDRVEHRFAGPGADQMTPAIDDAQKDCRDRIHTVRQERGLPAIERESADAEEALLIAAVDHRIDHCSVMVMKHDTRDVRPIPKPDESAPLLRKIQ